MSELLSVALVCAATLLAKDCSRDTALDVMVAPARTPMECLMHGQTAAAATGLTVTVAPSATVTSVQTSGGANPSFTDIRVGGGSLVNNAGTITNPAGQARDNFGVNLAGDLSTLNNTGTISLVAPAGNATTRLYGAYSSAPNGAQYASTTVTNGGTISVTQNGNGNAHGLFQFGQGTSGHVSQSGGQTGATFQFGW